MVSIVEAAAGND